MILSVQSIRKHKPLYPLEERGVAHGMSYGLGAAGYDIRIRETMNLKPGGFKLASTLESFDMPDNILGIVHDKSTWARLGLALQNTVIEPGWCGDSLTLELTNHSKKKIKLYAGMPIGQVVFHFLDEPTCMPYAGKYQHQRIGAQPAIFENNIEGIGNV